MNRQAPHSVRVFLPFLLVTVLLSIPFHLKSENFAVDDGYFYLQIARNIIAGHGSTFNGWLPTNGYHPLWMLVCCACAWLSNSTTVLLQGVSLIQDTLTLLCIGMLVWLAFKSKLRGVVFGCAVLWIMSDVLGIWRLLETSLSLTLQMIALLWIVFYDDERHTVLSDLAIGILLGLTLLARLDLVFFVAVLVVYPYFGHTGAGTLKRTGMLALRCAVTALTVAPYLAWNYSRFHHLAPISGAIKSTFPHVHHFPGLGPDTRIVVVGILINLGLLLRRHKTPFERVCIVAAVSASLHLAYCLMFGSLWPWYLTTGDLCLALIAIWAADKALRTLHLPVLFERSALAAIAVVLLAAASLRTVTNLSMSRFLHAGNLSFDRSYQEPRKAFAERLRNTFPPGTRFFVFDSPGSVAYYSGMSITPADGLVLDYAYNTELSQKGFAEYARDHGMTYVIAPLLQPGGHYSWLETHGARAGDEQSFTVDVPLTRRSAGTVTLPDRSLVFRNATIQPGFERILPEIGIWRLPDAPRSTPLSFDEPSN